MKENREKQPKNEEKKQSGEVSRRDFLVGAGTVVVGGAIGAGILSGCTTRDASTVTTTVETTKTVEKTTTIDGGGATTTVTQTTTLQGGTGDSTVTKTEFVNTGTGGAVLPAYEPEESHVTWKGYGVPSVIEVKNGKIVRNRPLHYDSKYPDIVPWAVEARGKTFKSIPKSGLPPFYAPARKRTDSPNRILYPLKRVDWEPGGDPSKINAQNRGISKYKRITADEATTIIADELKRVADKYGTESVFCCNTDHGNHPEGHLVQGMSGTDILCLRYWALSKYGTPCTDLIEQSNSEAGWTLGGRYVTGILPLWTFGHNTLKDVMVNCEMLLGWPADWGAKSWFYGFCGTFASVYYRWFRELGIKMIGISPDLNWGGGVYNDKWIPLYPRSDCAFLMAIAYIWITEGTYDMDYVDSHSVGFDKWKAYVMGDEDDIPKTPEWASPLCGVPEWTIKALADEWAEKITTIGFGFWGGSAHGRTSYGQESCRMLLYCEAMQGVGKPGRNQFIPTMGFLGRPAKNISVAQAAASAQMNTITAAKFGTPLKQGDHDRQFIPRTKFDKAILNPPVEFYYSFDPFFKHTYPKEGKPEVHLMYSTTTAWTGSNGRGFDQQAAYQSPKLECIIHQAIHWEDTMNFADIVLPVIDVLQSPGDIHSVNNQYHELLLRTDAGLDRGEQKSDFEWMLLILEKLGIADEITKGQSYKELTEGWMKSAFEKTAIAADISWEKLKENGYHCQMPNPAWYDVTPDLRDFYNDPKKNPLPTPSGLIEFESQELKANFPDDRERPPVAHYVRGGPESEGWTHDEDRLSERAKQYPLLLISNTSTLYRHHSMGSEQPWVREMEKIIGWDGFAYTPLWMSFEDAAVRGIKDKDIVKIFNQRGTILGAAKLWERIIPGAVGMEEAGGGLSIIEERLHRGGNTNAINPGNGASKYADCGNVTGFLVEVEKVTGNEMDVWREKYPERFSNKYYDPAYGEFFAGWVEGDI